MEKEFFFHPSFFIETEKGDERGVIYGLIQ